MNIRVDFAQMCSCGHDWGRHYRDGCNGLGGPCGCPKYDGTKP